MNLSIYFYLPSYRVVELFLLDKNRQEKAGSLSEGFPGRSSLLLQAVPGNDCLQYHQH